MKLEFFEDGLDGGPVILLYGGGPEEVSQLRHAVRGLAGGVDQQLAVDELPFVKSVDDGRLRVVSAKTAIGVVGTTMPREFVWTLDAESWAQVDDRLEPFCEQQSGGALQYLNSASGPEVIYSTDRAW